MFATGNEEKCPVMLFKRYLRSNRRNEEKRPVLPQISNEPVLISVWYKKTPMRENSINTIMKNMKKNSQLKDLCPERNLTNHSAQKAVVKKLKRSGILTV